MLYFILQLIANFVCHLVVGRLYTVDLSELFQWKQLAAVTGKKVESDDTKSAVKLHAIKPKKMSQKRLKRGFAELITILLVCTYEGHCSHYTYTFTSTDILLLIKLISAAVRNG